MPCDPLNPAESMPFVGEVLGRLRQSVGNEAAVLGFVGAPLDPCRLRGGGQEQTKNYAVIQGHGPSANPRSCTS